jgi:hypothetical protein
MLSAGGVLLLVVLSLAGDGLAEIPNGIPAELHGVWSDRDAIKRIHAEVSSLYEDKTRGTVRCLAADRGIQMWDGKKLVPRQ